MFSHLQIYLQSDVNTRSPHKGILLIHRESSRRLVLMSFDNVAIALTRRMNTVDSHFDDLQAGYDLEVTDVAVATPKPSCSAVAAINKSSKSIVTP